jgi:enoyl-CoA hydratase
MSEVLWERSGDVALLTLNRPKKRNALTESMVKELGSRLAGAVAEGARAVIIRGEGPSFCAGADIGLLASRDLGAARSFFATYRRLLLTIRRMPVPVLALIHGHAVGGGAEIAGEADFRVLSADATIAYPDVSIGSTPATVQRVARTLGDSVARRLVLLGEVLSAEEAIRFGWAYRVLQTREESFAVALELAQRLSRLPALSLELAKRALDRSYVVDVEAETLMNEESMVLCQATEDQEARVREFLERDAKDGNT